MNRGVMAAMIRRGNVRVMPEHTGGRVVLDDLRPADSVAEVFRESESYYVLGFNPTHGEAGQVRPDSRARRPQGRYDSGPARLLRGRPPIDVERSAEEPRQVDDSTRALERGRGPVAAHRRGPHNGDGAVCHADVGQGHGVGDGRDADRARPRDARPGGGSRAALAGLHHRQRVRRRLRPLRPASCDQQADAVDRAAAVDAADVRVPGRLAPRAQARSIRDSRGGRGHPARAVRQCLHVRRRAGLSARTARMSGLVIDARPLRASVAVRPLEGLAPVVPTTRRIFSPSDTVSGFVRIYQGLAAPSRRAMS